MAIVAVTGVLALHGVTLAQTTRTAQGASQGDFDACNREALAAAGGSASPRIGGAQGPGPSTGSTSGSATGGTTTGGLGAAGATGGTGSLGGGSTLSSGSTSAAGDPTLRGIASGGSSDPAFQQAYRECMRRRGF